MSRNPADRYPHTLLVYTCAVHRTRIEVVETGEDALEATCVRRGTMRPSSARSLTKSILRAAMRVQGIAWDVDQDDETRTFTYAFRTDLREARPPRKPRRRRNV